MGAVVPLVGLGLSAVGTIAGISEQKQQAEAQRAAHDAQIAAAQDRLTLSKQKLESTKNYAQQLRDQQSAILGAQQQNALFEEELRKIQADAQVAAARFTGTQTEEQAKQGASSILGAANTEAAQLQAANRGQAEQYGQAVDQTRDKQAQTMLQDPGTGTALGQNQRLLQQLIDAYQSTQQDINARSRGAESNVTHAQDIANIQRGIGKLSNEFIQGTADKQQLLNDTLNPLYRQIIDKQGDRNQRANEAEYYAASASADMGYLNNLMSEKANIATLNAQKSAIRSPGILSYVGAASGLLSQAAPLFANKSTPSTSSSYTPSWQQYYGGNQNNNSLANYDFSGFNDTGKFSNWSP